MFLFILNQSFSVPVTLGILLFLTISFFVTLFIVAITNIVERDRAPFVDGDLPYTLHPGSDYDIDKSVTEVETEHIVLHDPYVPLGSTKYTILNDQGASEKIQIESTSEATVKPKRKYTRKPKEDTIPAPRKRESKTKPLTIKKVDSE